MTRLDLLAASAVVPCILGVMLVGSDSATAKSWLLPVIPMLASSLLSALTSAKCNLEKESVSISAATAALLVANFVAQGAYPAR